MIDLQQNFLLANISVDPNSDQLCCNGSMLEIQSMAMKVLCYFAHHNDQLITRDELRENVWNNSTTSNHTINNHIYSLRRAIGKLDPDTKYIHTVTGGNGNGYRLLVSVSQIPLDKKAIFPLSEEDIESLSIAKKHTDINSELTVSSINQQATDSFSQQKHRLRLINANITVTPKVLLYLFVMMAIAGYFYVMNQVSYDHPSTVSFLAGREQSPAINHDGTILLYSNKDNRNEKHKRWQLYASYLNKPEESKRIFRSKNNSGNFVSLSPNSKYLTFTRYQQGAKGIYIADFDSETLTANNAKLIIDLHAVNLSPAISWLNENQFFYSAREAANAPLRIYLYDLALDNSTQVTSPPINTFGDMAAVVSPNKHWLAIMRADGENGYQLNLLNLTNKYLVKTKIVSTESRLNISFSDDSNDVYHIDEQGYLASYDIKNKMATRISNQQYIGYWPLKIPGKAQFILQQDWGLSSLTTQIIKHKNPLHGGDGSFEVVVNNGLSIRAIEGTNDGLIFASIKPNYHVELWQYKHNEAHKLSAFSEQPEYRYPLSLHWLKGSETALLSINKSCRLVNITSGKDSPLCPAKENVYAARYSFNGDDVFLAGFKNETPSAVKMGKTGYPFERLEQLANANLIVQISENEFYYSEQPSFDIYHFDANTQQHKKIIDRTYINNPYSVNDFVVTTQGIYFMDRIKVADNAIYFYDFKNQKSQRLLDSKDNYPNIVVSEEEQSIYLIQSVDNDSELILLEQ